MLLKLLSSNDTTHEGCKEQKAIALQPLQLHDIYLQLLSYGAGAPDVAFETRRCISEHDERSQLRSL